MSAARACPDEELLATFALAEGPDSTSPPLEQHLLACDECAVVWRGLRRTVAALTEVPGLVGSTWARLERSVDRLDRFAPYEPACARVLDVTRPVARQALFEFHDGAFKEPLPGFHVRRAPIGASLVGAFAVLARLQPGVSLPFHRHLGDEATLVLHGRLGEPGATSVGPGEILRAPAGSAHEVSALGDDECCCIVVAQGGVAWA